jgi:hypothetical protein
VDVANTFTPPVVVDYLEVNALYSIQYLTSGGAAGTGIVQQTEDDPFNPPSGGLTWATVAMVAGRASINAVARAFRVSAPVLADVLNVVQQGAR